MQRWAYKRWIAQALGRPEQRFAAGMTTEEKQPAVFKKLGELRPDTAGHNLTVKVGLIRRTNTDDTENAPSHQQPHVMFGPPRFGNQRISTGLVSHEQPAGPAGST